MVYLTNRDGCIEPPGIALFGGGCGHCSFIQLEDELIDEQAGERSRSKRDDDQDQWKNMAALRHPWMNMDWLIDLFRPGVYIETNKSLRFFPRKASMMHDTAR